MQGKAEGKFLECCRRLHKEFSRQWNVQMKRKNFSAQASNSEVTFQKEQNKIWFSSYFLPKPKHKGSFRSSIKEKVCCRCNVRECMTRLAMIGGHVLEELQLFWISQIVYPKLKTTPSYGRCNQMSRQGQLRTYSKVCRGGFCLRLISIALFKFANQLKDTKTSYQTALFFFQAVSNYPIYLNK